MKLNDVVVRLKDVGLDVPAYTVRRKVDTYLPLPNRNQKNNWRDVTEEEYQRLMVALALEAKGVKPADALDYLDGKADRVALVGKLLDAAKVDGILRQWAQQ